MAPAPPAARPRRTRTLSEPDSKALVARFGVRIAREAQAADPEAAARAAGTLGFPVVLKLAGDAIAHKTERGLVRVGLADGAAVAREAAELMAQARPEDGAVTLLVAEQVAGRRELIAGLVRDPQFGSCVLLGQGGVLAEALADVVFAIVPLSRGDAFGLIDGLATRRLFTEGHRGEPPLDREALADVLEGLSRLAQARPDVESVDLNPLILRDGLPIAVDALVEIAMGAEVVERFEGAAVAEAAEVVERAGGLTDRDAAGSAERLSDEVIRERFRPLFHPRAIVVAGVASHPGKFGFVTFHNLLRCGFKGSLHGVKPDAAEVLGRATHASVDAVPGDDLDLVFLCTPNKLNAQLLRDCARRGIRAAFVASAGYAEAGPEGAALQRELVATADELGMLLVGPNGQGVVSTPESMCAQIVAPYPPAGRIGVASQSGNLVSSFLNHAVATGVGISKAVSLGNSAQTGLADLLEYFAVDPDTDVALCYVESIGDGRRFRRAAERLTRKKPLVLVKGGARAEGQRAAASHTGALASDDRVFDGLCRQLGILRAPTVEEAFEWAATLATQPLPRGRRVVVFTSVGGWGVLAADACAEAGLELIPLPEAVRQAIDARVPARWSRGNPIDLAGGETRDTIPELLEIVCADPGVDAVIHLGVGIQAATAAFFRSGPFFPDHGLERMAEFHERQDRRYVEAGIEASRRHGKPVLCVSELVVSNPENPGPATLREQGRLCHPSAHRAVRALAALVRVGEAQAASDARGPAGSRR
ncbi:MAG: acetate--CoA ligase family protein [Deltaproteobacteria bacterium]|nr:acetate--CoA ligase family protein [Deltaproteobacteria bacterium]